MLNLSELVTGASPESCAFYKGAVLSPLFNMKIYFFIALMIIYWVSRAANPIIDHYSKKLFDKFRGKK